MMYARSARGKYGLRVAKAPSSCGHCEDRGLLTNGSGATGTATGLAALRVPGVLDLLHELRW
jgi:hypothetical protein